SPRVRGAREYRGARPQPWRALPQYADQSRHAVLWIEPAGFAAVNRARTNTAGERKQWRLLRAWQRGLGPTPISAWIHALARSSQATGRHALTSACAFTITCRLRGMRAGSACCAFRCRDREAPQFTKSLVVTL